MMSSSNSAVVLAFLSGILLIVAGAVGSVGIIGTAIEYAIEYLGGSMADMLSLLLQALNLIASLGGLAVIAGGILIYVGRKGLGKFIIGLGAGMGLIGFLVVMGSAILHGWSHTVYFLVLVSQSLGWIGTILAIFARVLVR